MFWVCCHSIVPRGQRRLISWLLKDHSGLAGRVAVAQFRVVPSGGSDLPQACVQTAVLVLKRKHQQVVMSTRPIIGAHVADGGVLSAETWTNYRCCGDVDGQ